MHKIWTEILGLKTEANVEMPKDCILSKGQQGGNSTGFWYLSLWENDPISYLIYNLSKQFSN